MEEIVRFVVLAQSGRFTVTELCEQFGISRKTGYKYLERYASDKRMGKMRASPYLLQRDFLHRVTTKGFRPPPNNQTTSSPNSTFQ